VIAAQMKVCGQSTSGVLYKRMREFIFGIPNILERIRLCRQIGADARPARPLKSRSRPPGAPRGYIAIKTLDIRKLRLAL
jgi:hypothetical protein